MLKKTERKEGRKKERQTVSMLEKKEVPCVGWRSDELWITRQHNWGNLMQRNNIFTCKPATERRLNLKTPRSGGPKC